MNISTQIKSLMDRDGLNQKLFSEKTGIYQTILSRWENETNSVSKKSLDRHFVYKLTLDGVEVDYNTMAKKFLKRETGYFDKMQQIAKDKRHDLQIHLIDYKICK